MEKRSGQRNVDFLNSRAYRVIELLINLFLLNLLWLVTCVPLITAWPATAAMFGVVRGWLNNTDEDIAMPFIRQFKANFAQSLWLGILWLVVAGVLAVDLVVIDGINTWLKLPLFAFVGLGTLCFLITSVYIFPVMVNYAANWRIVIKNSFLIALAQPGTTIPGALVIVLALAIVYVVPLAIGIAGSGTAYILYFLCKRAFIRIDRLKGTNVETTNESETV